MPKSLRQLKEDFFNLLAEVTIDGKTGEIEDDNSPNNKNLQRTPKNTKSASQQPNMSQQKQLPPPASNNQKALPSPQTKALANPSKVPVVVPSTNVAVKKPEVKPTTDNKPEVKPTTDNKPEVKPTTDNKPEAKPNLPAAQEKKNLPATQEKKPQEKYMGKIEPEKKATLSTDNKPEAKPEAKPTTDNKPEAKPTTDNKPEASVPLKTKTSVSPKAAKASQKNDHIVKSGEAPKPNTSSKPGMLTKVKSALSAPKVDFRPTKVGYGARYRGPEHLIKQPTRPPRRI